MRALRLFALSFSLVACGGGASSSPSPEAPAPAAAPAPTASAAEAKPAPATDAGAPVEATKPAEVKGTAPVVRVIEAGNAPRRALRYAFKAGTTERAEVDMKMSMAMTVGDRATPKVELPTMRMVMRLDAKEITPEGDLRLGFETEKVEVLKDAPMDAQVRGALEKELAGIVGMHGKSRVSTRGVASEIEFELPPGASPQLTAQLDSMRDALRSMYVPFPEEEVGKDAKWEVTSRVPVSGALMDTKLLYTLKKLEAESAAADVETTLSAAPNQKMTLPALPPKATALLESLSGTGTGKASPSFVKLVGSGQSKVSMDMTIAVDAGQEKLHMKTATTIGVVVRPGKASAPAAAKK